METEFNFNNKVLNTDLKDLLTNVKGIEITKGKVSGYSIEVFDKENGTQGSYVYYKDINKRDEDYNTLLEAIEFSLEKQD